MRANEFIIEQQADPTGAIFLSDQAVIVGQTHGKPLNLSPETLKKVQDIAKEHGAWSEGNRSDEAHTQGQIPASDYKGSWDNDLFAKNVGGYPWEFIYSIMSNVAENRTWDQIGTDPDKTIFNQILDSQARHNFFPGKNYNGQTLLKFLEAISEGQYNFVEMSKQPATKENVNNFLMTGQKLMWPQDWASYPNRAGKVAKAANDQRDRFLADRTKGAYMAGTGHLLQVQKFSGGKQINENK